MESLTHDNAAVFGRLLHERFDAALAQAMQLHQQCHRQQQQQEGQQQEGQQQLQLAGPRVLDMRGDWSCSAISALQRGASYVLATHLTDTDIDTDGEGQDDGQSFETASGYWRSVLSHAAKPAAAIAAGGTLEMQSAGIGEMLAAGWELPTITTTATTTTAAAGGAGFDVIVTELVDCMGAKNALF